MSKTIDWKIVRRQGLEFQKDGGTYRLLDGTLITGTTRGRHWLKYQVEQGKNLKLETTEHLEIKKPPSYKSYIANEIAKAGTDHDFKFPISIKVRGLENDSKWLALDQREYKKLLELFK